jgi:hypothetical protein
LAAGSGQGEGYSILACSKRLKTYPCKPPQPPPQGGGAFLIVVFSGKPAGAKKRNFNQIIGVIGEIHG